MLISGPHRFMTLWLDERTRLKVRYKIPIFRPTSLFTLVIRVICAVFVYAYANNPFMEIYGVNISSIKYILSLFVFYIFMNKFQCYVHCTVICMKDKYLTPFITFVSRNLLCLPASGIQQDLVRPAIRVLPGSGQLPCKTRQIKVCGRTECQRMDLV